MEHILAVRKQSAFVAKDGFTAIENNVLPFEARDLIIAERSTLENDSDFMQVIPYVLIKKENDFLVYRRTKKSGESKLTEKLSCGFGGHINISDIVSFKGEINLRNTIINGVWREIDEELEGIVAQPAKIIGMIADRSNDVGRVHLGFLIVLNYTDLPLYTNDESIEIIGFKSIETILRCESVENWTRIALEYLE